MDVDVPWLSSKYLSTHSVSVGGSSHVSCIESGSSDRSEFTLSSIAFVRALFMGTSGVVGDVGWSMGMTLGCSASIKEEAALWARAGALGLRALTPKPGMYTDFALLHLVDATREVKGQPSDNVRSVREDVLVDDESIFGDFINLKMMCRLSFSEVLIRIGYAYLRSSGAVSTLRWFFLGAVFPRCCILAVETRMRLRHLIAAEYSGVNVELVKDFQMGVSNHTPDFLKMNPIGKVPVLETPDGPVFESNAIARYGFWDMYDPEGYSLWFCDFKYNEENTVSFVTMNKVGGFLLRMDLCRKYAFGKMLVIGSEPPFKVKGLWLFRGPKIPKFVMEEVYDMALYDWAKVDLSDAAQKERVSAMIEDLEPFEGEALLDAKCFK
ncbi:uncharacterized protein [Triticum aestivum]|uniref:uncharacterized protein n=1 Tax=Triticum aestivum TaxID=4565 RepID=UPI001D020E19|nr:uncharacterized protein LOC123142560 [Triticum aestivum]